MKKLKFDIIKKDNYDIWELDESKLKPGEVYFRIDQTNIGDQFGDSNNQFKTSNGITFVSDQLPEVTENSSTVHVWGHDRSIEPHGEWYKPEDTRRLDDNPNIAIYNGMDDGEEKPPELEYHRRHFKASEEYVEKVQQAAKEYCEYFEKWDISHGKVYFHINNGGIIFEVRDSGRGPEIHVSAGHFGHRTNQMKIYTTKDSLKILGKMLSDASDQNLSSPYCHASKGKLEID